MMWISCRRVSSWIIKSDIKTTLQILIIFRRFHLYSLRNKKSLWKISQPLEMMALVHQIIKVDHSKTIPALDQANFKLNWVNQTSRMVRTVSYCLLKKPNLTASLNTKKNIRNVKLQNPNISPSTPSASRLKIRSLSTLRVQNTTKISLTFWFTNVKRWAN